jgi:hypothetical protein
VNHIFVKKPQPEMESVYFSNVNQRKMVEFLKSIFKGENYIQISNRKKDNYIVVAQVCKRFLENAGYGIFQEKRISMASQWRQGFDH